MKYLFMLVEYDNHKTTKEQDESFVSAVKGIHEAVQQFGSIEIYEIPETSRVMFNRIKSELRLAKR